MRVLVDTNVLIEHLHGAASAAPYFTAAEAGALELLISVISEYELLRWPLLGDPEATAIGVLLERHRVVSVDRNIAQIAAVLAREHYRIGTADILIAATAIALHAPLLTRNIRDFRPIEQLEIISKPPSPLN